MGFANGIGESLCAVLAALVEYAVLRSSSAVLGVEARQGSEHGRGNAVDYDQ